MPMPQSWSKKKKARMNFAPKQSMPDLSNLIKAMEDSLLKQDNIIWDYRVSKYWYDSCKGYIEVVPL
jgi:Holliday junction resolvase RusA-like endonuclease